VCAWVLNKDGQKKVEEEREEEEAAKNNEKWSPLAIMAHSLSFSHLFSSKAI